MSAWWLVKSREDTNFTYDLMPLNRGHLAWFAADVAGVPTAEIRAYLDEIEQDETLKEHIRTGTLASALRGVADRHVRYTGGESVGTPSCAQLNLNTS